MITTKRITRTTLALLVMLFVTVASVSAQTGTPKIVKEYSLGDGYQGRDILIGAVAATQVKFPDRFLDNTSNCSTVLFTEGMVMAVLKVFKDKSFLNKTPYIEVTKTAEGAMFYADTIDGDRIEIRIVVDTLETRKPIGVQLTLVPMPRS